MLSSTSRLASTYLTKSSLTKASCHYKKCFTTSTILKKSGSAASPLDPRTAATVQLLYKYRSEGHLSSQTNPLTCSPTSKYEIPAFSKSIIGSNGSLTVNPKEIGVEGLNSSQVTLESLSEHLAASYCGPLTAQLSHLPGEEQAWISSRLESVQNELKQLPKTEKLHIHELLQKAETFDHYLQKKFRTVKRYGLEGNEAMLVALDHIFDTCAEQETRDIVLTMLHRGRLNTLVHLLNYPMDLLVHRLKGLSLIPPGMNAHGDVLSHIDQHTDFVSRKSPSKQTHISFIPNPSHLESSAPVAAGKAYARQKQKAFESGAPYDGVVPPTNQNDVLCVMVHGDASVAGQGVVPETALLANLKHFSVGGSVHIVANNQLGFTAMSHEGRSFQNCSDVALMLGVPVFRVSGEHPEHVLLAAKFALDYRNKFKKDVWIDLVGYRKHGHNELDEPAFTQPTMYANIRSRKSIPELYAETLVSQGIIKPESIEELRTKLDSELEVSYQKHTAIETGEQKQDLSHRTAFSPDTPAKGYVPYFDHLQGPKWQGIVHPSTYTYEKGLLNINPNTAVDGQLLVDLALESTNLPSDFVPHERLARTFVDARRARLADGVKSDQIDWATAEAMAVASLMNEGHHIRICGQDACRGTFSQRHMKLTDQNNQKRTYMPLNNMSARLNPKKSRLEVINSPLSEFAVMGFEYGHSLEAPRTLHIWEAQYGDFVNGAQIMLDNYLSSSDDKWLRQTGLVLNLPHGYDGAGPEHSSCHLERFLQSADTDMFDNSPKHFSNVVPNWGIVQPTTPANYFHVLRRQLKRNYLRPLIIATPKQLLRDPLAVSSVADLSDPQIARFQPVLPDPDHSDAGAARVRTVVLCSGKIFYELRAQRKERKQGDTCLIRVEEYAPFPAELIKEQIKRYPNARRVVWVQDEPQNMGAWAYVEPRLRNFCGVEATLISPPPLAPAAVGSSNLHKKIMAQLYDDVFAKI